MTRRFGTIWYGSDANPSVEIWACPSAFANDFLDVKMIIGVFMYRHVDKFAAGSYPYQADWVDEQLVHLLRGIKFRTIPKQRSTNDTSAWTVRSWQGTASNASCPNGNLDPLRVVVWKPSFQVAELLWMVNHLLAAENRPTQRTWNVVDFGGIWSQIISDLFGQKITAAADCFSLAFFSYINLYYIYIRCARDGTWFV